MSTLLRTPFLSRNIWTPRIDTGSLAYHTPFWYPSLQGTSFKSLDKNAITNTVVGATWGSQGRTFDGNDDYIDIGKPSFATDQSGTLVIWYKFNTYTASDSLFGFAIPTAATAADLFFIYMTANTCLDITAYDHTANVTSQLRTPASSVSFGVFQQLIITSNGSTTVAYINGVSQALTVMGGANQGDWLGDVGSYATNIHFGNLRWNNVADRGIDGIIGEGRYYSQRVFSAGDVIRDYQSTKWTFSL